MARTGLGKAQETGFKDKPSVKQGRTSGTGKRLLRSLFFALPLLLVVHGVVIIGLNHGSQTVQLLTQVEQITADTAMDPAGLSAQWRQWAIMLLGLSVVATGVIFAGAWQVGAAFDTRHTQRARPLGRRRARATATGSMKSDAGLAGDDGLEPERASLSGDPLDTVLPPVPSEADEGAALSLQHDLQILIDRQVNRCRAALGATDGALATLLHRHGDDLAPALSELVTQANDGAQRAADIIAELSDLSHIRATPPPQTASPVQGPADADRSLEDALQHLLPMIEDSDADIRVEALPKIAVDAALLEILFRRLVGRILNREGVTGAPRITVTAERDGFLPATVIVRDESDGQDPASLQDLRADLEDSADVIVNPLSGGRSRDMDLVIAATAARQMGCWLSVTPYPPAGFEYRLDLPGEASDPNGAKPTPALPEPQ